jgi:lysozyme
MTPTAKAIDLIKRFEGCRLTAYLCPANVPTIGYGTIRYSNGEKVKEGDVISSQKAIEELTHEVNKKAEGVNRLTRGVLLSSNQFDALVSFAYNLGLGALEDSTLLKRVKANPNDPDIRNQFMKWVKLRKNGVLEVSPGLVRRRKEEANLYFS